MQIRKIRVKGRTAIVKWAAFIGLGVFVAQMLKMDAIVSMLFACSFVCVVINYLEFISARNRMRLDDIMLLLITLVSVILSDWQLGFDYIKPAIIVLCSVLCIDQCAEIETNEKTCNHIRFFLILVCVITNVLYYGGLRYVYHGSTSLVSLNLHNPNETAIWLTFFIVLLCDSALMENRTMIKLLLLACMFSLLPILYRTQSRNCLFVVLFFFVGKLFLTFLKVRKLPKWFIFLITMAPILVYMGYMYIFIPYYDRLSELFSFLASEGKPLTARNTIWSNLEMSRIKHIFLGNYAVYHTEQLHNSMLTLYSRFGIFFVVIVCRKIYKTLSRMPNAGMQLALSAIWLTGCFETSIFAGVSGMYMLVLLLPIFHQPEMHKDRGIRT